jgi:hypothetical protein
VETRKQEIGRSFGRFAASHFSEVSCHDNLNLSSYFLTIQLKEHPVTTTSLQTASIVRKHANKKLGEALADLLPVTFLKSVVMTISISLHIS